MPYCLGRIPSPPDVRTLRLASYLDVSQLPPAPSAVSWGAKVGGRWGVMLNDRIGCCTVSAAGHLVQQWTANESGVVDTIPDAEILRAYSAVSNYIPGRPATDRGANMLDVLRYWRSTGIGGHKGIGFVAVDPANLDQVKAALWLFGGLYGGCEIFRGWLQGPWDNPAGGTAGGHAWELCSYDADGFGVVTWGQVRRYTWRGWAASMRQQDGAELYAVLGPEWTAYDGVASSGFDAKALANDLAILGGQPMPYPDPPPPVPAPQPPTPTPTPPNPSEFVGRDGNVYRYVPARWERA